MSPNLQTINAHPVLPLTLMRQRCLRLDLSTRNPRLEALDPSDTKAFCKWLQTEIEEAGCTWAAGGYGENRELYSMSEVFSAKDAQQRTLHLGLDLWMPAGTPVFAWADGLVHSLADNNQFGDYGPTVILEHPRAEIFSLTGHMSRESLASLKPGDPIVAGQQLGRLGDIHENVGWPPHLHFQLIRDLQGRLGDYPGVCAFEEKEAWLANCPDPTELLLSWCE